VLASGLVFGVAAAVTDAAWTDQELARGSFVTGTFATQSSVDTANPPGSGTWSSNGTTPATLSFNASAMIPGTVVRAPLAIRAAPGSLGGSVSLAYSTSSGDSSLLSALQLAVYVDTSNICATSATPDANGAWVAGSASTYQTGLATAIPTNTRALPASGGASTPGTPVYYCFIVQLPSDAANTLQGTTATATWVLNGTT
jgi:predicted ribosomally synthesized peptide with SipW-like signal peptide